MLRFRTIVLPVAVLTMPFVACSSGDTADDLTAPVEASGGAGPDSSTAGQAGAKEDAANTGEASATPEPRLPVGLAVREVAVFQAVKVPLARDGAAIAQRNAPVLAGRAALFRIHIEASQSFTARVITAELRLSNPGTPAASYTSEMKVFGGSSDEVPGSAFDIEVPGDRVTLDSQWSVQLLDQTAPLVEDGVSHPARFPLDGAMSALDAQADGPGLQLVLVPLRYDTDGSGRLPDTSDTQLERYRVLLTSVYPYVHTELAVREPVAWNKPLSFGNVNFNAVNDLLYELKENDGAPGQSYYYGLITPAESFDDYCGGSCVTGQSYVVDEADAGEYRIGAGMGFTGEDSGWTLIHELGHLHGRSHAPCHVTQSDPNYPYGSGHTGVWGWDSRDGTFQDPEKAFDLMGYCEPTWISDYTFAALFQRVIEVGALRSLPRGERSPHRFLHVDANGLAQWGRDLTVSGSGVGGARVRYLEANGGLITELSTRAVRQSGGGYSVLVPKLQGAVASVQIAGGVPNPVQIEW